MESVGKYKLQKLLGKGGMGEVWLSHHPGLDIPVAIKILKTESKTAQKRFLQEGKLAAAINHPNLVRVFDADHDGEVNFLVMEFIEGKDYKSIADSHGGKLDVEDAVDMVKSVCKALTVAHENKILHRDVKPENILKSTTDEIKLADLGIAKLEETGDINTIENTALGTPYYISPEQAVDAAHVDKRADIYSLGATLYHLVTGTYPFKAKTPVQMLMKHVNEPLEAANSRNPEVPPELSQIISKMMEKNKDNRYQNCGEVIDDLEKFIVGYRNQACDEDAETLVQSAPAEKVTPLPDLEKTVPMEKTVEEPKSSESEKMKQMRKVALCVFIAIVACILIALDEDESESGENMYSTSEIVDLNGFENDLKEELTLNSKSSSLNFTTWTDSSGVMKAKVPEGWTVDGGPGAAVNLGQWKLNIFSPDGKSFISSGHNWNSFMEFNSGPYQPGISTVEKFIIPNFMKTNPQYVSYKTLYRSANNRNVYNGTVPVDAGQGIYLFEDRQGKHYLCQAYGQTIYINAVASPGLWRLNYFSCIFAPVDSQSQMDIAKAYEQMMGSLELHPNFFTTWKQTAQMQQRAMNQYMETVNSGFSDYLNSVRNNDNSAVFKNWSEMMRGTKTMSNPQTGDSYLVPNSANRAYVTPRGEIFTDQNPPPPSSDYTELNRI